MLLMSQPPAHTHVSIWCERKAEFYRVDVTEWRSLLSFFAQVKQKYQRVDLVFANAGVGEKNTVFTDLVEPDGSLAPPDLRVVDINLKGVIYSMPSTTHACDSF